MSYDLYLEIDTGGAERAIVSEHWNYTSNVAPMWRLAMPETDGLAGMEGLTGAEAAEVLRAGIARMEAEPAVYRALDPPNGWGSFDGDEYGGTLQALKDWLAECERHPKATMTVSR